MSYSPLEILLDTTYLLPILGVDVPGVREVLEVVEKLYEQDGAVLFYSPFSLLEAIGKITKMSHDVDRVRDGLSAIIESGVFRIALPSLDGYVGALIGRAILKTPDSIMAERPSRTLSTSWDILAILPIASRRLNGE